MLGATDIVIGVNAVDSSGYPDCRPEFIAAFEALSRMATKAGVAGRACGRCDSCRLRRAGFEQASVADPARYG